MRTFDKVSRSWMASIDGVALFCFAAGTMIAYGAALKLLGVFVLLSLVLFRGPELARVPRILNAPSEILSFTLWVVWAGATGPLVATSFDSFWVYYPTEVQIAILMWAVYALAKIRGEVVDGVFWGLAVGWGVQAVFVLSGVESLGTQLSESERAVGTVVAANPNSLGIMSIAAVLSVMMFWRSEKGSRVLVRGVIVAAMLMAAYIVLISGSRKSLLGFAVMIACWSIFVLAPRNRRVRFLYQAALVLALTGVSVTVVPLMVEYTNVGQRFREFTDNSRGLADAAKSNARYTMYVEGLRMFVENPICGVGLNNFREHSESGLYSHSDYIEPLANTGLIGFVLYQGFYVLLIVRLVRLLRSGVEGVTRYRVGCMLLGMVTIMLLGFGAPHHTDKAVFLLMSTYSACAMRLQFRSVRHCPRSLCTLG